MKICAVQLNLKNCFTYQSFYNYLEKEVFQKIPNNLDLIVFPENINLSLLFVKRPKLSLSIKTIFETIFDKLISLVNLSFIFKYEDLEYQKEIILTTFSELAKKYSVNIITGSFYERTEEGVYNTIYAIDRQGNIIDNAVKKDLVGFEKALRIKSKAENKVVYFDFAKVGMSICFDLNDPKYIEKFNCDILVAPSNGFRPFPGYPFNFKKETPQIQRAKENNFVVIRPYCAGWLGPLYFQGHTMIVDYLGNVVGKSKSYNDTELIFAVI